MCRLFAPQDPATYAAETRAVCPSGHATSVCLERAFWAILERIAEEGTSVARFASKLHDEVLDREGAVSNLASLLRVSCLHWLRNRELHAGTTRRDAVRSRTGPPQRRRGKVSSTSAALTGYYQGASPPSHARGQIGGGTMGGARLARTATAAVALVLLAGAGTVRAQTAPAASPPDGATLFRQQCGTCHVLEPGGPTRQGPHLQGVVGREAGKVPGFRYSPNLAAADWAWDEAKLDAYLTNPQQVVKGGIMPYRQGRAEVRAAIIEYLKAQKAGGSDR